MSAPARVKWKYPIRDKSLDYTEMLNFPKLGDELVKHAESMREVAETISPYYTGQRAKNKPHYRDSFEVTRPAPYFGKGRREKGKRAVVYLINKVPHAWFVEEGADSTPPYHVMWEAINHAAIRLIRR
jgi:hypothetical protein